MSIQCWDSNPQPSDCESHPITTRQWLFAFNWWLLAYLMTVLELDFELKNEFTLFGRIYSCVVNRADGCDKNVLHSGSQNEDLMIWMRTAALPSFRKLYRRISHVGDLEAGLPDTRFKFVIDYNFNVKPFSGTKSVVISKSSFFGALNYFIGIAFLIFGGILGPKTIKHFLLRPSSFSGLLHGIIFLNWDNTGLSWFSFDRIKLYHSAGFEQGSLELKVNKPTARLTPPQPNCGIIF